MMQRAEELPEAHEPELGGCLASAVWGGGDTPPGQGEKRDMGTRAYKV